MAGLAWLEGIMTVFVKLLAESGWKHWLCELLTVLGWGGPRLIGEIGAR